MDESIKSIDAKDLPPELSDETCEFISEFRRKTVNEENEWNIYLDYDKNEVIHCFKGNKTNVKGMINTGLMGNRKILSIHNHPKGTYSAPSAANFEILENEFQDYEIICAQEEYWILESKEKYSKLFVEKFKTKIEIIFQDINLEVKILIMIIVLNY